LKKKSRFLEFFQENAKCLIEPSDFGTYFFKFLLKVLLETFKTLE